MIGEKKHEKLSIITGVLDQAKAYINPNAYMVEHGIGESEVSRKNALFEDQTRQARETGVMRSPKMVREVLHDFYKEEQNKKDVAKTFVEITDDGRVITTEPQYVDDTELG